MGKLAVVAGSMAHAKAVMKWERLDEDVSVPLTYGQALDETHLFQHVLLVRPTEGMTPEGREWICNVLAPRVADRFRNYPLQWSPAEEEAPPVDTSGPVLEENPLYA